VVLAQVENQKSGDGEIRRVGWEF